MSTPAKPAAFLDAQTAAFIQRHVSINLATTDADNRPAVTRVFGSRVSDDRAQITLFLSSSGNAAVLDNLRANGRIAVVFSRPSTHRTLQLKGTDARLVELQPDDLPLIAAYRASMIEELGNLGYPPAFTGSLIPPPETLDTAIRFTPQTAYSQTPGPQAGHKLPA